MPKAQVSALQLATAATFNASTTLLLHISNCSHRPLPSSTLHITPKSHINTKQGKHLQIAQFSSPDLHITSVFLYTLNLVTSEGEIEYGLNGVMQTFRDVLQTTVPSRLLETRFTNNTLNISIITTSLFLFFLFLSWMCSFTK